MKNKKGAIITAESFVFLGLIVLTLAILFYFLFFNESTSLFNAIKLPEGLKKWIPFKDNRAIFSEEGSDSTKVGLDLVDLMNKHRNNRACFIENNINFKSLGKDFIVILNPENPEEKTDFYVQSEFKEKPEFLASKKFDFPICIVDVPMFYTCFIEGGACFESTLTRTPNKIKITKNNIIEEDNEEDKKENDAGYLYKSKDGKVCLIPTRNDRSNSACDIPEPGKDYYKLDNDCIKRLKDKIEAHAEVKTGTNQKINIC